MAETFTVGNKRITVYDLSCTVSNDSVPFEPVAHHIEYSDPYAGLEVSRKWTGMGAELWPDGAAWVAEQVRIGTHVGTHIDAPWHYGPKHGGGMARTIDEVPLRWTYGDGVVLNFVHKARGDGITDSDVKAELTRIGYAIKPYDVVLIRTDVSQHYMEKGYDLLHSGLRRSATEYLVDAGVKLIGIDAWGIDRPMDVMAAEAKAGDKAQFWESHLLGREKEYCQIEKLANLAELPKPFGFTVMAFPVKLKGTSAAWARVVAQVEG
jgi:kynurenine formamidase